MFNHNDYEIVKREILHQGNLRMVRYHLRNRLFNGEWSEVYTRELLERCNAVAVLPYDPYRDHVILVEQFRVGALAQPSSPWTVEVVAGLIEETESPEEVARREGQEEAGCVITELELIGDYFVSPGGSNEYLFLYCGKTDSRNINGIHGLANEHEDIRVINIPVEEAFARVRNNEIKTSPAILAIQWLELNRGWLREKWQ